MSNESILQQRQDLIRRTIRMETVERIPAIYMGVAFSPRYMGMSIAKFCADPEASLQVTLDAMDRIGNLDGANIAVGGRITTILSVLWLSRLAVPGRELPDDTLWQVMEEEVLKVEEYDQILKGGWKAFQRGYLPRVVDPQELAETMSWMMANGARVLQAYAERGYVVISDAQGLSAAPPFESLCGGRSMQRFFMDLVRMPDKVEAVMQVMMEETLADMERVPPRQGGIGGVWLGGWRGASGLLSPKMWNRFVWPYIEKLANVLIAKDYVPVLHWDQNWTRDLERLNDLPAGKCILNPDGMTSMRKFKEVAGNSMAMMGDVSSVLLATGKPEDVTRYVRELVDLFEGKGLLMCAGCDAPINARPENIEAMYRALEH